MERKYGLEQKRPLAVSDIVQTYPGDKSRIIVVRMAVEVDTALLWENLDSAEPGLTVEDMVKVLQWEMEQIKEKKHGLPTKLPAWFKQVNCAEIEENREDTNG